MGSHQRPLCLLHSRAQADQQFFENLKLNVKIEVQNNASIKKQVTSDRDALLPSRSNL